MCLYVFTEQKQTTSPTLHNKTEIVEGLNDSRTIGGENHKPLQLLAPSLANPAGQLSHFMLPNELMHFRLLSHPPLFFWHSSTSKCTSVSIMFTTETQSLAERNCDSSHNNLLGLHIYVCEYACTNPCSSSLRR